MEEELQRLIEDFLTQKQTLLLQVKKGLLGKEDFLAEAEKHLDRNYSFPKDKKEVLLKEFEQYVFGYSRLSPPMTTPLPISCNQFCVCTPDNSNQSTPMVAIISNAFFKSDT